jgi:hypothetical protein
MLGFNTSKVIVGKAFTTQMLALSRHNRWSVLIHMSVRTVRKSVSVLSGILARIAPVLSKPYLDLPHQLSNFGREKASRYDTMRILSVTE